MKIYIASYTDDNGHGYQKLFYQKKNADIWLNNKILSNYEKGAEPAPKEYILNWKQWGAFTGKIKTFNIKNCEKN